MPVSGSLSQYPGAPEGRERLQIVLGLDFGTAFTKVVIADRRRAYAVPLFEPKQGNAYLLPGIFFTGSDGSATLGPEPGSTQHSDLKMRLLEGDLDDESLRQATCFLALVFRQARGWFLTTHQLTYRGNLLDWYVNVGMPTDHYHQNEMTTAYRRIVAAAWAASTDAARITLEMVGAYLDGRLPPMLSNDAIAVFPEFVGQINGYVRSPLRRNDLHLLVDVGAGTLDVAVFNVHRSDDEDVFPIFGKSVKPLGVHFLQKHRVAQSHQGRARSGAVHLEQDATASSVMATLGVSAEQLNRIDAPFAAAVLTEIQEQVRVTRTRYYPESRRWTDGLTFFLCGGGSQVALYADLAARMERDRAPCALARLELPRPERLEADRTADAIYDRLSVAYGLSFDALDIGQIQTTGEIDPGSPIEPASPICSHCNGTGGWRGNDCVACDGRGWL